MPYTNKSLNWRGNSLWLGNQRKLSEIVQDTKHPTMWRVQQLDGSKSDMVNIVRARDLARRAALVILNGYKTSGEAPSPRSPVGSARIVVQIPIPDDCCALAREMVKHGLDPDTVLEFMRGDVVSLRGSARAFASRMLSEKGSQSPRHVRYDPVEAARMAHLSTRGRSPIA